MLAEDDVSGLLSTKNISILKHILINVLVTNCCLLILHTNLITSFIKSKVRHDCCNNCIVFQFSLLHEIFTTYIHNAVSIYNISILINCDTSVSISVISKSDIQMFLFYILLQNFDMCRTTVCINIHTIWLIVDYISLCSKCIEYTLCNAWRTTIRTVKSNSHILEGTCCKRDQMTDITVSSCCIVNCAANALFCCQRDLINLPIDISLDLCLNLSLHLMTFAVDYLDTIIIVWIVARWNHKSTVKIFCSYYIWNTWCGRYMKKVSVSSWCCQSCSKCILKHVAASSCVFSDYDSGLVVLSEIPSKITSYFKCMLYCKNYIRLTTETICSKIFSHNNLPFLSCDTPFVIRSIHKFATVKHVFII